MIATKPTRFWARTRAGPQTGTREAIERHLEVACAWGAGHLLLTGPDRGEVRDLLECVLRRVDALGSVRARACDDDPDIALEGLLSLSTESTTASPIAAGYTARQTALLDLIARARAVRRSVFVVVDDGEDATIEQLERLRTSLEVAPDAIECFRLVLVGGQALAGKLEQHAARALRSRITARVHVGATSDASGDSRGLGVVRWAVAAAAAATTALAVVAALHRGLRIEDSPGDAKLSAQGSLRLSAALPLRPSIRGSEPFLSASLRIPIRPDWVTGSGLYPPPVRVLFEASSAEIQAGEAVTAEPTHPAAPPSAASASALGTSHAAIVAKPLGRHAPEPTSSIASLLERFR
jgi:hypothetical protein